MVDTRSRPGCVALVLKAAAEGLTSYEGLMVAAINQLPIILSMFS